ncbi:MAG: biotin carboxylase N-terminal domain-containing protein [Myxococcota bacterium]
MINRLLIAERGEAAVRIARTCKRLGIGTVTLRAEVDTDEALHVDASDETRPLVTDPEALVALAAECEADAIHPGYAENVRSDLVRAAASAGVTLVAASADARAACTDPAHLARGAEQAGLRRVPEEPLHRPRRIDVVAVADAHGTAAALGEMELLLSEGGTTVLAEAPSPALLMSHEQEALRQAMDEGTERLLTELGVCGVAQVGYLLDMDGHFWLDEVVPGLPSLHAPIEMITGLDLVELQLRATAGDALDPELQSLQPTGHAFVTSVQAVSAPGAVAVTDLRWPPAPHGRLRVDPSTRVGEVPEDTLLLKMATVAPVRHLALLTLDRVLAATTAAPYEINVSHLRALLNDESFRAGQYDTSFVERVAAA